MYERELLWHWNGDGALLSLGADPECNKRVLELARLFPAVSFSGNILGSTQTVTTDQAAGGVLAAHHFLELGYRNFAWFETPHDPSGDRIGEMRGAAFRQTVETAGYNCAVLERLGSDAADRKQRTICRQRLLAQLLELPKPLALFAFDDPHAVDAIEMCLDAGLRVPEDVAVLGVGNLELACECSMVPISSVEYDLRAIGYAGACLLEQVMAGNPAPDPMPPF
ncbi:MAG TPA: substrate-binding domain-containing protein, partial [Luteolibacter sp.]